jgi:hypothetical protein
MLKPVEQVDRLIDLRPVQCCGCGALLLGEDPAAQRHQVTELPRIEPVVIEYRRHTLSCLACGTETAAAWPADMPTGGFGSSVQAMVGYLTGRMGISQRDVEEAMAALFKSGGITAALALGMILAGGVRQQIQGIPRREAVVVVGLGWLLSSACGGLPYLLCPPGLTPAGAFFEAASGFTTTGSSAIMDLELWPRGLLMWRSVTQWLGGIGILVLFVAVLAGLAVAAPWSRILNRRIRH